MIPRTRLFSRSRRRSNVVAATLLLTALASVACTPMTPPGSTTTTTTTAPSSWTAGACPTNSGVTVVVDVATPGAPPVVRCALGAQSSGLVALANAGFTAVGEPGVAPVCQIDGFPAEGFPFCWLTGGYWSYWAAPSRGAAWQFATTGPGAGPVPQGSVQGWAWAPGFTSDGPGVGSDGT
jgi:hypothetical protein